MSPSSPTGGPPLRAIAMVLIAFAILFGALGAFSLSGSSSSSSASSTTTDTSAAAAASSVSGSAAAAPPSKPSAAAASTTEPPAQASAGTTTETTKATTTDTAQAPAQTGPVDKSQAVRVLNNSMVHGLANTYASKLRADGWTNLSTGNYPSSDAQLPQTTVYYGDGAGEQAAAQSIASLLGATALPKSQGVALPTSGVVVIVTSG